MRIMIHAITKRMTVAFFFLIFFSIFINSYADDKIIKLATLEWPPYISKQIKEYGFTAKISTEAFKRVGYSVSIHFMPWAKVLKDVERGKFDAGFPAYYSKERDEKYGLSHMIAKGPLVFATNKNTNIKYSTLKDLKDYKIGIVRGYVNSDAFDNAQFLNKMVGNSDEQNLKRLLKKRLDIVVVDQFTAVHFMNTILQNNSQLIEFLSPPLDEKELFVAFSKKNDNYKQLLEDFNHGLELITTDGTIQSIMKSYGF